MAQQTPQQTRKREHKRATRRQRRQRTAKNWRSFIDWQAAGRKAYESKMRNLRAHGGKRATKAATTSTAKAKPAPLKTKADTTEAAYVERVTAAIARTMTKDTAPYIGLDMGGGWRIVATDGFRALTRQGGDGEAKPIARPHQTAAPARFGINVTPELESALRGLLAASTSRHKAEVTIEVNGRKRQATLTLMITREQAAKVDAVTVPITGKLATVKVRANLRWLLDGFGRGGRLGYSTTKARAPLGLDTTDGLRYVLMPVVA